MIIIRNHRLGVHDACGLRLLPGNNPLDTPEKIELWEKVKESEVIQSLMKPLIGYPAGMLQELKYEIDPSQVKKRVRGGSKAAASFSGDFNKLKRKEKIEIVEGTYDIKVLKKWDKDNKDSQVKKAIRIQIEKITPDIEEED